MIKSKLTVGIPSAQG